jgi:uncharacterized membrane protein YbhN (UPF0104 family)
MTESPPSASRFSRASLRRLEYLVVGSAVCFVLLMVAIAATMGLRQVWRQVSQVDASLLLILLSLSLLNYLCRMMRWHLLSRRLGLEMRFVETLLYFFSGFALTTTPGKLGEAIRLWLINRRHGYSYARVAPLAIGDRLADVVAVVITTAIGLSALTAHAREFTTIVLIVLGMCLFLARPKPLMALLTAAYRRIGRAPRLFAGARRAIRLSSALVAPRSSLPVVALSVAGWLAECFAFYLLLKAMGPGLAIDQAIFTFSFSMLVGGFSMLPGGLGGTEITMVALLSSAGIEIHQAIAATAIIRVTTLWFAVGLGLPAMVYALRAARPRQAARPRLAAV